MRPARRWRPPSLTEDAPGRNPLLDRVDRHRPSSLGERLFHRRLAGRRDCPSPNGSGPPVLAQVRDRLGVFSRPADVAKLADRSSHPNTIRLQPAVGASGWLPRSRHAAPTGSMLASPAARRSGTSPTVVLRMARSYTAAAERGSLSSAACTARLLGQLARPKSRVSSSTFVETSPGSQARCRAGGEAVRCGRGPAERTSHRPRSSRWP